MSIETFRKALCQLLLSQEERASLTTDELFVLVLARRLDRLTKAEQQRLKSTDLQDLVSMGLIAGDAGQPASATGGKVSFQSAHESTQARF
jgi:hypothetical protein